MGNYFSYVGIWVALSQIVLTRLLNKKFTEPQILRVTYIAAGITILAYFLTTASWELFLIGPFTAACVALSQANNTALISRSVSGRIQGEILGINASIQALAQTIPPVLAGFIAVSLTPESPVIVSSIVLLIGGVVFLLFFRPHLQTAADKTD